MNDYSVLLKDKTKESVLFELEEFAYKLGYSEIKINERICNITYKKENRGFRSLIVTINIVEISNDVKLIFNFPNKTDLGLSKNRFMKKSFEEMKELIYIPKDNGNNQINEKIEVLKNKRDKDDKNYTYKIIGSMVGFVVLIWIIYEIYTYIQLKKTLELMGY